MVRVRTRADGLREFYELTPADGNTYRVALAAAHGDELADLQEAFELVWATTWRHDANRLISPILGLPQDLAVMPLSRPRVHTADRSWKADQVAEWVGPRAFAWFDDEINRATRHWLEGMGWLGPHLALRVDPRTGLTDELFDLIWSFADSLT